MTEDGCTNRRDSTTYSEAAAAEHTEKHKASGQTSLASSSEGLIDCHVWLTPDQPGAARFDLVDEANVRHHFPRFNPDRHVLEVRSADSDKSSGDPPSAPILSFRFDDTPVEGLETVALHFWFKDTDQYLGSITLEPSSWADLRQDLPLHAAKERLASKLNLTATPSAGTEAALPSDRGDEFTSEDRSPCSDADWSVLS